MLVVDNDNEDDTSAAVIALGRDSPVPLEVVREPIRGLSQARNRALHAARGRAGVYIDDDITCRAGWVAVHARGLAEAEVLAMGGLIQPVLPEEIAAEWRAFRLAWLGA